MNTVPQHEGRRVSKEFAKTMLETFDRGLRFMSKEHIEARHILLNECVQTGQMDAELESVFQWVRRDNPDIDPNPNNEEGI